MASRGVNKVILVGNLGNDPEIRYTNQGKAVAVISVATSESWKDKNTGQQNERTEWHRVEFWGRLAEVVGEYLRKGSKVYIEGSIHTDKWQDQQGNDRYSTKIKAAEMQMLDSRQGQQPTSVPGQGQTMPPGQGYQAPQNAPGAPQQMGNTNPQGIPGAGQGGAPVQPGGGNAPDASGQPGFYDDDVPF